MLGLGLALSVGRKLLGDAIGRLIQELSIRGTYSENLIDTRNIITDIDDADVLDKATILLTPTATSDARVHSVKTYTGDELLDVSSLSGTNWTADGSGGFTNNGSGEGLNGSLNENTIIGATYKFTFDVTISGIANATFGGVTIPVFTTSGSKEYYVIATSSSTSFSFYLAPSGSPSMFVNNISIVDVSSDFDFDRASSATRINSDGLVQDMQSITDPELVTNGTFDTDSDWVLGTGWNIADGHLNFDTDDGENNAQQQGLLTVGRIYKMTFDANVTTGTIRFESGTGSNLLITSSDTTVEHIFEADLTALVFRRNVTPTRGYIDNISVKDITFSEDVDLARINYDSNGENGHILLEPTSTNLITYSEDIDSLNDGDGEVAVNSTLTYESDVVAPDGSLGVYRIQNPATASTYLKVTNNTTAAQSMSVWVKAKTVGTNNQFTLYRDGTGSSVSDVKTATGEWQRFEYSWSTVGSGAYFINNDGDTYISDLYVWGIQVENLPYTTSYIPNHGTAAGVTRAAETLNGSGNSTLINTTQGTIYLESKLGGTTGTKLFSIGAGTNNADPAVLVGYSGSNMYFDFIDGSSLVDSPDIRFVSGINTDSYNKMAVSYTSTSVTVFLNGVKKVTKSGVDFTPTNSLKALYAGYGVGSKFEGEVKTVAVFNEAFEDDELELLTGVTNYNSFNELASANGYTII
jgi:hypothetical protein